jgi:hypothetical protein
MTESIIANRLKELARREGSLVTRREDLLRLVQRRFPSAIPAEVVDLIGRQDSEEMLGEWFDAAIDALSVEVFLAAVRPRSRCVEDGDWTESIAVNRLIEEARREARLSVRQESVLLVAEARFPGAVPADVLHLIRRQDSDDLLKEWYRAVIDAPSAAEFLAIVRR